MMPLNLSRTNCPIWLATAALLWLGLDTSHAGEFDVLSKQADQNNKTEPGRRYLEKFQSVIFPALAPAMHSCNSRPDTVEPAKIVFIISAKGRITRVISTPGIEYGECIASEFKPSVAVPRPPRDSWAVAIGVANHNNAAKNAPADRSVRTEGDQTVAYDKAIAPCVAKARATYSAAKKRFLAGLPPNYRFTVGVRLYQTDQKAREQRHEDVFVAVEQIKDGKVYGRIANKIDLLTNYHEDDQIQFPESDVMNWTIVRPDGSEEGNYVGKFLEHWNGR